MIQALPVGFGHFGVAEKNDIDFRPSSLRVASYGAFSQSVGQDSQFAGGRGRHGGSAPLNMNPDGI